MSIEEDLGYIKASLDTISSNQKDLINRVDKVEEQLSFYKNMIFFGKCTIGVLLCVATLKFGDISSKIAEFYK